MQLYKKLNKPVRYIVNFLQLKGNKSFCNIVRQSNVHKYFIN